MDLLKQTKEICRLYNIKPARSKGQSFLISEKIYDKIVKAARLEKSDKVLEVGPGLGFLTSRLAKNSKEVIAVELDDKLASFLESATNSNKLNNVKIFNEDILKFNTREVGLKDRDYKVVANLPYNISSIFLRTFLSSKIRPSLMILMLQKEVAERIVAGPGDMSLLAVSVQFYSKVKIVGQVPKKNFWPEPKVDSAIVEIEAKDKLPEVDVKKFFQLVKFGFSAKRKMLKNNLAAGFKIEGKDAEICLKKAGIEVRVRAEDLSLSDWVKLLENL